MLNLQSLKPEFQVTTHQEPQDLVPQHDSRSHEQPMNESNFELALHSHSLLNQTQTNPQAVAIEQIKPHGQLNQTRTQSSSQFSPLRTHFIFFNCTLFSLDGR
ncbi:hypothetical protein Droror1_Dr00015241 [Drosera rotundifolia]